MQKPTHSFQCTFIFPCVSSQREERPISRLSSSVQSTNDPVSLLDVSILFGMTGTLYETVIKTSRVWRAEFNSSLHKKTVQLGLSAVYTSAWGHKACNQTKHLEYFLFYCYIIIYIYIYTVHRKDTIDTSNFIKPKVTYFPFPGQLKKDMLASSSSSLGSISSLYWSLFSPSLHPLSKTSSFSSSLFKVFPLSRLSSDWMHCIITRFKYKCIQTILNTDGYTRQKPEFLTRITCTYTNLNIWTFGHV